VRAVSTQHTCHHQSRLVYGTLVNYVVGLEANSDNTTLLQGITEADPIKLTALSGKVFSFRYSGRQWVTVDKRTFSGKCGRELTLVLLVKKAISDWWFRPSMFAADEVVPRAMSWHGSVHWWMFPALE